MSAIYTYHDIQTVFIHMPKCGGTTIKSLLESVCPSPIQTHGKIPDEATNYFTFSLVRDPFERFISAWAYCRKKKWTQIDSPIQFLRSIKSMDKADHPVVSHYHKDFRKDNDYMCLHHSAPITHPDRLFDRAKTVFRLEHMEDCLSSLSKRYDTSFTNRTLNSTEHDPFQVYYDSALYHQVLEYYAEDFKQLKYPTSIRLRKA